jgi:hypothetical protein
MARKVLIYFAAFVVSLALALVLGLVVRLPEWLAVMIGLSPVVVVASLLGGSRVPPDGGRGT